MFKSVWNPCLTPTRDDLVLCIYGNRILLDSDSSIPVFSRIQTELPMNSGHWLMFGTINGQRCLLSHSLADSFLADLFDNGNSHTPLVREALIDLDESLFSTVFTAVHLNQWLDTHKFCGRCGFGLEFHQKDRALICPSCTSSVYPRISPAVIVAVTRDKSILLAHNKRFPEGLYSLIAGFVDAGETLEQCVAREVEEETGIKVKNIRYIDSQPWPFPDSLMVGFSAEYDSGEIQPDGIEIEHAGWYDLGKADDLPTLPRRGTIALRIIERIKQSIG